MSRAWRITVELDELLGLCLFSGINDDETISAYVGRKGYKVRVAIIDFFFGAGHCAKEAEEYLDKHPELNHE